MPSSRKHIAVWLRIASGYGRSTHLIGELSPGFHYQAAAETLKFMDALGIDQAFFWGHSDGAVIAAILGFTAPERVKGLILEAFHFHAQKPGSRAFFEVAAKNPEGMGPELSARFARDHGDDYWRQLITTHAKAWLDLGLNSTDDLYHGRLAEVAAPTLLLHGRLDPRTEAGEIEEVKKQLPAAKIVYLGKGTHSPHSEILTADLTTKIAAGELDLWLG
ncbi:MAG TPA: alpha/beta hydrolase [Pyrinomonadaceae bacterium]|nr:alpha/beta hydrolase [Pyrinomonadaceae bacterium]